MSIKKVFNGQTIRKPGAYSRNKTDNSAGATPATTGVIYIVGESSKGAPGSVSGIVEYPAERLSDLIAHFGSGPLVDCAHAAVNPSKQSGIGGASSIQVYKTNQSTQASAMIKKSGSNIFQVRDSAWGVGGNDYQVIVAAGSSGSQKLFSVAQIGGTTESLGENAAQQVLSIRYTGNGTTAAMTITGATQQAKTLATTLAGDQTDGSANLSILLKNYTMKTLVDYINSQVGYLAVLITPSQAPTKANQLDPVTAQSILTTQNQFRLQYEMLDVLNSSARIEASIQDVAVVGVPDNATTSLTGGAQGASSNTNFSTGFANSLAEEYNILVPAVSRDASEDIADAVAGFTDPSSSYTVASVQSAMVAHLVLRGSTQNRKEAQGNTGVRKSSKAAAFAAASTIGSELVQCCIEDALFVGADGNSRFMHPHVVAAMAAGMRLGNAIGEPLTHKYPNVQQVGHFINPQTGLVGGDFNPGLDASAAIDAGVLFMEKARGGYRWVVDNTTYGIDNSFIYNRGSVMQAVQYTCQTIRQTAEDAFVGGKSSNGAAKSIKNVVGNKLKELNQPDVQIITSSDDAPNGFVEKTFIVTVTGNTGEVQVEFKPVQGLDFIFFTFTLGDTKQSA